MVSQPSVRVGRVFALDHDVGILSGVAIIYHIQIRLTDKQLLLMDDLQFSV